MKKTTVIGVMALLSSQYFLISQTVSTPVVGFEKKPFAAGTTGHGVGFVQSAKFQGTASSVTSGSIAVGSSLFTAGAFAPANGLPTHYIQITSGSQNGLVVDILSNTQTTLTVANGELASVTGTPSFVVRPHVTVSSLFKGNTNLADYMDTVLIYNSDGSVTTLLRDSSQTTGWVDSSTFNQSDSVIYPGQAFLLNTSSSGSFTTTGQINPNQTIVPIYQGLVNLVSLSNPSASKDIQGIGLGQNLSDYMDTVGLFSTDGNLAQNVSVIWGGVGTGFLDSTTFNAVSNVAAPGSGAMIVNASINTSWTQPSPLTP